MRSSPQLVARLRRLERGGKIAFARELGAARCGERTEAHVLFPSNCRYSAVRTRCIRLARRDLTRALRGVRRERDGQQFRLDRPPRFDLVATLGRFAREEPLLPPA
jgi:hypothetical protein